MSKQNMKDDRMACPLCNDTGDQRYWEGRWRDEKAELSATRGQLADLGREHQAVLSERDAALDCAQHLARVLWEKHYKNDAPHWTVGNDLVLVISQIDNMTAGMMRSETAA